MCGCVCLCIKALKHLYANDLCKKMTRKAVTT